MPHKNELGCNTKSVYNTHSLQDEQATSNCRRMSSVGLESNKRDSGSRLATFICNQTSAYEQSYQEVRRSSITIDREIERQHRLLQLWWQFSRPLKIKQQALYNARPLISGRRGFETPETRMVNRSRGQRAKRLSYTTHGQYPTIPFVLLAFHFKGDG